MDQMKKNGFWILLGLILLGEAGFWFVVVHGRSTEIDKRLDEIRDLKRALKKNEKKKKDVPSKRLVSHQEDVLRTYNAAKGSIKDYYVAKDVLFEPDWPTQPSLVEYTATYNDNMNALAAQFREKMGAEQDKREYVGFKKETGFSDDRVTLVEKRYKIQKRLSDIMVGTGVTKLNRIKFDQPKKRKKGTLPYSIHPVTLNVDCPAENIPELIAQVLRSPTVPARIGRVRISKIHVLGEAPPEGADDQYETQNVYYRNFGYQDEDQYNKLSDDEILPEPPIRLDLMFDVIDVDQEAIASEESGD